MRPISELLYFLEYQMSMQAIYQPVIVLRLLTLGGVAIRADLARTLSGYDEVRLEEWDRILMKNPRLTLVNVHNVLMYDELQKTFALNFELTDAEPIEQAKRTCEASIMAWIRRNAESQRLDESEVLRLYRVLNLAKEKEAYVIPEQLQLNAEIEDFSIQIVSTALKEKYPNEKISQQPHGTIGFDILIGSVSDPVAYVKVKATTQTAPFFSLTESERQFSIANVDRYHLALVYNITLSTDEYAVIYHLGAITTENFMMLPQKWYLRPLEQS